MNVDAIQSRARALLAEQRDLVSALLRLREQVRGSLFARWAECRKPGCACAKGDKHGPYFVLSGGPGGYAYLEEGQVAAARGLLARSKAFRQGLKRLVKVNGEIVKLMSRYQQVTIRRGSRRLRLLPTSRP